MHEDRGVEGTLTVIGGLMLTSINGILHDEDVQSRYLKELRRRVLRRLDSIPSDLAVFGFSPDEGIKTGIKMPLDVAWQAAKATLPNQAEPSLQKIACMMRRQDFEATLLRLAYAANGTYGDYSSLPGTFSSEARHRTVIEKSTGLPLVIYEQGRVTVPGFIRAELRAALRLEERQNGCPMRSRYNYNPESLIIYASRRVADCLDIIGSASIPDFVPSIRAGNEVLGSDSSV